MPWNGSGAVSLTQDFSADRDAGPPTSRIDADKIMDALNDIGEMIAACLNRNGENALTENVDAGAKKFTNMGAGSGVNDSVRVRQVAENTLKFCGTAGGTADAITGTNTAISTLATGTRLELVASATNNASATFTLNGGDALDIVEKTGVDIEAGKIVNGKPFVLMFNGTNYTLCENGLMPLNTADIGVKTQAYAATLTDFAGLTPTKGNIPVGDGTNFTALGVGTNGYVPVAKSGATNGIAWSALIAAASITLWYSASAPVGWTVSDADHNKAIRVVSGASGLGGAAGGTTAFTDVFTARTDVAAHTHTFSATTGASGTHTHGGIPKANVVSGTGNISTAGGPFTGTPEVSTDAGGDHTHTVSGTTASTGSGMDFAVQYISMVKCAKDAY